MSWLMTIRATAYDTIDWPRYHGSVASRFGFEAMSPQSPMIQILRIPHPCVLIVRPYRLFEKGEKRTFARCTGFEMLLAVPKHWPSKMSDDADECDATPWRDSCQITGVCENRLDKTGGRLSPLAPPRTIPWAKPRSTWVMADSRAGEGRIVNEGCMGDVVNLRRLADVVDVVLRFSLRVA